jgi:hypothetical protein
MPFTRRNKRLQCLARKFSVSTVTSPGPDVRVRVRDGQTHPHRQGVMVRISEKAATRLRWRRRRQPITRPGPPPARRSPSPVLRMGRLQGFWAEDAGKRSRRGRAWRNRADETISGPAVSYRCHAQPPAPATPAPGAPPSRTPHTPFGVPTPENAARLNRNALMRTPTPASHGGGLPKYLYSSTRRLQRIP